MWGRNYALCFAAFFQSKSKVAIPTLLPTTQIQPILSSKRGRCRNSSDLMNDDTATCHRLKSSLLFDQKRAGVTTHQIWLKLTPPHATASKARYFWIKTGLFRLSRNLPEPEQSQDAFFNQKAKSEFRPCFQQLRFNPFFHQKGAGVALRQI